jgi:hypothetical protein
MGREDQSLPERLKAFLRKHYTHNAACLLAQDIDCDVRTAKNILSGFWPRRPEHLQNIVKRFGEDAKAALFGDDPVATGSRLAGELRLEQRAERRRAIHRQAEGRMARGQGGVGETSVAARHSPTPLASTRKGGR